jgi:cell division septal protein FtsQ
VKNPRTPGRRGKASPAKRLRTFWVPILLLAIVLLGIAAFAVAWPGFDPKTVAVGGNRIVSRTEIVSRAAIRPNVNMWLQSPGAIARRVEAIPYVRTANVHRIPPSTVAISVTERTPFAVVRSGNASALVDADMRVLAAADAGAAPLQFQLPPGIALDPGAFLTQPSAVALHDDYEALTAAHVVPDELEFDRFGGLVAVVRGGIKIMLGDDADLSKKLPLIDPILAQVVRKQRGVAAVDLRAPGTPVVVYK